MIGVRFPVAELLLSFVLLPFTAMLVGRGEGKRAAGQEGKRARGQEGKKARRHYYTILAVSHLERVKKVLVDRAKLFPTSHEAQ